METELKCRLKNQLLYPEIKNSSRWKIDSKFSNKQKKNHRYLLVVNQFVILGKRNSFFKIQVSQMGDAVASFIGWCLEEKPIVPKFCKMGLR